MSSRPIRRTERRGSERAFTDRKLPRVTVAPNANWIRRLHGNELEHALMRGIRPPLIARMPG